MFSRELRRSRRLWLSLTPWKQRLLFWSGAVAVGATAAFFAIGSEHAIDWFGRLIAPSPWLALLVTPAGLALTAYLTRRYFSGAQGSGIPQTIPPCTPTTRRCASGCCRCAWPRARSR